jgi:hypothetical protein
MRTSKPGAAGAAPPCTATDTAAPLPSFPATAIWSGAVTGMVSPVSMIEVSLLTEATTPDTCRSSPTARSRVASR